MGLKGVPPAGSRVFSENRGWQSAGTGLAEEAGAAYKDIDEVVKATEDAGISKRVVRFNPIGNVKG